MSDLLRLLEKVNGLFLGYFNVVGEKFFIRFVVIVVVVVYVWRKFLKLKDKNVVRFSLIVVLLRLFIEGFVVIINGNFFFFVLGRRFLIFGVVLMY